MAQWVSVVKALQILLPKAHKEVTWLEYHQETFESSDPLTKLFTAE